MQVLFLALLREHTFVAYILFSFSARCSKSQLRTFHKDLYFVELYLALSFHVLFLRVHLILICACWNLFRLFYYPYPCLCHIMCLLVNIPNMILVLIILVWTGVLFIGKKLFSLACLMSDLKINSLSIVKDFLNPYYESNITVFQSNVWRTIPK